MKILAVALLLQFLIGIYGSKFGLKSYKGENALSLVEVNTEQKSMNVKKPKRIRRFQSTQLNYEEPFFYNHALALSPRYSFVSYIARMVVRKLVKLVGCVVFSSIISIANLNESGLLSGVLIGAALEFILSFGFFNTLESAAIKGQFGIFGLILTVLFKAETFFGILMFYLAGENLTALFLAIMVDYVGGLFVQAYLAHEFGLLDEDGYSKLCPGILETLSS